MLSIKQIRKNNVLEMLKYAERKDFAAFVKIDYLLLNQYLPTNAPKNIGNNNALKITEAFKLPEGWLDHEHSPGEIKLVMSQSGFATDNDANISVLDEIQTNITSDDAQISYKLLPITNYITIERGKALDIVEITEPSHFVYMPPNVALPITFEVKGGGYIKPFKNGYVLLCDKLAKCNPGEDIIIQTNDKKIVCGEFLFERDGFIDIESIEGERLSISSSLVITKFPVVAFFPPSQKQLIKK
ncbi:hypothetical protein APC42_17435 [Acinetobacter pittii]|uniref:hypothetical protein n=1 Tax=Acinetobacter pittii TaxID=48296 RepID=UPI00070AB1E0|nr:hypothetical protein [Acinetobacter pittii]KRI46508.1 hypothetical protein APC42_17435 [Acinetobacter pittii]